MPETESYQAQLLGITESVDSLLNKWDLNQVQIFLFPDRNLSADGTHRCGQEHSGGDRALISESGIEATVAAEKLKGDATMIKSPMFLKTSSLFGIP